MEIDDSIISVDDSFDEIDDSFARVDHNTVEIDDNSRKVDDYFFEKCFNFYKISACGEGSTIIPGRININTVKPKTTLSGMKIIGHYFIYPCFFHA